MSDINRFVESSRIPTLPELALKLVKLAQQPEPDYAELAKLLSLDPSLSGRILKTANSALFGLKFRVTCIEEALPKLGLSLVRTLVLGFHLADYRVHPRLQETLQNLWRRSLVQACAAELLGARASSSGGKRNDPMKFFLAAMIQDIGSLAMLAECPAQYLEVLGECDSDAGRQLKAESETFGMQHAKVSAEIARRWGLEVDMVEAIEAHHQQLPWSNSSAIARALQAAALVVPVLENASGRQEDPELESGSDCELAALIDFLVLHYDFDEDTSRQFISDCCERLEEYSLMLTMDVGECYDSEEILRQTHSLLSEYAIASQLDMMRLQSGVGGVSNSVEPTVDDSHVDVMTGFYNRRFMVRKLRQWLAARQESGESIGIAFIDVDKFKSVNDTWGHAAGDEVITCVARSLAKTVREKDLKIRYGGDEFLIIVPGLAADGFSALIDRLADTPIEYGEIIKQQNAEAAVTLSIGCVFLDKPCLDELDANALIEIADQAMYSAKRSGGARVSHGQIPADLLRK